MLFHKLTHLPDKWVLHKCNNPQCCNPKHLVLGTPSDNAKWRSACGRSRDVAGDKNPMRLHPELAAARRGDNNPSRMYPESRPRGSAHGRTTLVEDDIREIRAIRISTGRSYADIAREYSRKYSKAILPDTIELICKRRTWKHVL